MVGKSSFLLLFAVVFSMIIIFPNSYAQDDALQEIDVGGSALWVEISGDKVYVANPKDGIISVIDTNTNQVVDTITAIQGVLVLDVVEEQNRIYATVESYNKVLVFDLDTHEKIKEIDLGDPEIVRFSKADKPYGQREYTYFSTNGIGIKYNSNNQMLYAVHSELNEIKVIDTNTDSVVDSIKVGKTPLLIEIDEPTNTGYVTNIETNDVSVVDLDSNEETDTLSTGWVPDQMEIDNDNRRLYVTHHASPHVTVIDLNSQTIEDEIRLDGPTHAIALDEMNDLIHVTYMPESVLTGMGAKAKVDFIDTSTNQKIGGFEIIANPFTIDIDSENQRLFASVISEGTLLAVDLSKDPGYQNIVAEAEEIPPETTEAPGGGCLIATATYGSEMSPQVQQLRELRDNSLLTTESGSAFMTGFNQFYYSFSPTIADWERQNPVFKEAVKLTITPLITSLSILNYVDIDSEAEVLRYGISLILLNIGMYVVAPVGIGIFVLRKRI